MFTTIVTEIALRWRSNASFSLPLLFTQHKTTWRTATVSAITSPCITCKRYLRSTVTCGKVCYRNLK